jgi:hypothetical protein
MRARRLEMSKIRKAMKALTGPSTFSRLRMRRQML